MKPDVYSIPYNQDSSHLLRALAGFKHLVALESNNPNHPNGRWSIISASPVNWIEHSNKQPSEQIEKEILDLLEVIPKVDSDLPFTGGILGLISYDLGESHIACSSKINPNPLMVYGLYTWAFMFDHKQQKGHLLHWPNLSNVPSEQLLNLTNPNSDLSCDDFEISKPIKPRWTKHEYLRRFDKVKDYISSGDCYQINLTQSFEGQYNGQPIFAYEKIKQAAKAPYSTYFDLGDQCLASGSPELFIEFNKSRAITKPIKGTRPRSYLPQVDNQNMNDLLHSEKDRAENIMIVDLLRNDLSKHGMKIQVEKLCELETFETVHHLVSTITAEVSPKKHLKALLDAFPGGSITGAPKTRAMEIIKELEDFDRRFYCGSCFAISSNQKVTSNILIRSFIFDYETRKVTCWAGGGIVADSDGEEEYQESLDKISKLIEAIS